MEKKFSSRDIAEFKRTARNVWPEQAKKVKLEAKIAELQAELTSIDTKIALKESYVKNTTGYGIFDIIERVVTTTLATNEDGSPKLDEKGKQVVITNTDFVLKYPETVIPLEEVNLDNAENTVINSEESVEEVESSASEAPFNPIAL